MSSNASAAALDASVSGGDGTGADPVAAAQASLDAAQAKVTKQKAHLAGAKKAVTEAKAALAAAKKSEG